MEELFEFEIDNLAENRYGFEEEIIEEGVVGLVKKIIVDVLLVVDLIIEVFELVENERNCIVEYEVRIFNLYILFM